MVAESNNFIFNKTVRVFFQLDKYQYLRNSSPTQIYNVKLDSVRRSLKMYIPYRKRLFSTLTKTKTKKVLQFYYIRIDPTIFIS